jgi:uncharacterized protein (DUF983 family)
MITNDDEPRPVWPALLKGARGRCPACGKGALFHRYLKVSDRCPVCSEELHHQRADDAPPYIVILVVGHVIVGAALSLEMALSPPSWVHMVLWLPLAVASSLLLLPIAKGVLIALQWAMRMHGFGRAEPAEAEP